jgi:hypothetical protein
LDDWIYCTLYIHTLWECAQYSAIAILHTFQFTVTHALGFSVFTSRILATDLSQCHWHFKSHLKSYWYSLIPFLTLLLNHLRLPSIELDPILFLLDYFTSRLMFSNPLYISPRRLTVPSYNSSVRTSRKTPSSIVKNSYLLVRYLAMGIHVTVCIWS